MVELQTETIKCPNCGGELDPPELAAARRSTVVKCAYCGKRIRLRLPAPPPSAHSASEPVAIDLRKLAGEVRIDVVRTGRIIAAVVVVILLIAGITTAGLVVSMSSKASELGAGLAGSVEEPAGPSADRPALPVVCADGESRTISGQNLSGTGLVVRASGSCQLTISNANLHSTATVIEASGDARVVVDNSNVIGASAIAAAERAVVTVTNSTLRGSKAAYTTSGEARVVAGDSNTVSGPVPAAP